MVNPFGQVVKVMNCGTVVSKFNFQSRHDVHFPKNTHKKELNTLSPSYELNCVPTDLLEGLLWH